MPGRLNSTRPCPVSHSGHLSGSFKGSRGDIIGPAGTGTSGSGRWAMTKTLTLGPGLALPLSEARGKGPHDVWVPEADAVPT